MRVLVFSLFLLMSVACAPALGQSGLDEKQKAVLVLDVQMDKIRDCALGKSLDLEQKMNVLHQQSGDGPNPAKLERVMLVMSAPEDMQSAMGIQMGQLPMEFSARMSFSDAESASKVLAEAENDNSGTVEKNGKTYYKSPEAGGMPPGILMHAVDDKTIEIGTEAYVFLNSKVPFTDNLKSAYKNAPNEAIRLVADLEGAKTLIGEAIAMGQQGGDPMVGTYLGLIDNMKDMTLSIDLSGKNLLTISATGVSEEEAEELKSGLDSLLGMAKLAGQAGIGQMKDQDPESAAVAAKVLESLSAKNKGTNVSIEIPKPEGFDEMVVKKVNELTAMFGGFEPPADDQ